MLSSRRLHRLKPNRADLLFLNLSTERGPMAIRYVEDAHARGKVVINVSDDSTAKVRENSFSISPSPAGDQPWPRAMRSRKLEHRTEVRKTAAPGVSPGATRVGRY
jgi:hypothetical protein